MKFVIIGGVAGGATAAARIRRNIEQGEIILFEKGDYISYANCGLPYYIGGVIAERDKLFVQTPDAFGKRFNIDVRTRSEVVGIDVRNKSVKVRTADGREYEETYDRLLLSPGASPVVPPLAGIGSRGIFTLRNVSDTDKIKSYIASNDVKRAVIVGGGFIGLEMAENLKYAGIDVSVVEMANQVMGPIDYSMAAIVHQHLQQKGVGLYLEQAVESFVERGGTLDVNFKSGITLNTDMVILSIGVRAETRLAADAGLKLGEMRGIYVDEYLQTSEPGVYAVGDAIEYPHPITGKPWLNFLAGPANRQARIVADNMTFGNHVKYEGSIGTSIAKVFDLTVAATGLPAKRLKMMGMPYASATIHPNSHAGYYPGAMPKPIDPDVMTTKIQAVLRRAYDMAGKIPILEHRGAVLNLNDASLTYNGERIELTKNEFRILQTLLENKGKAVSRDTLMIKLWQMDSYVEENTLTVNVTRLRKKLAGAGLPDFIATKVGIGYIVEQ